MNHLRISLAVLLTAVLTGLFTVGTPGVWAQGQSTALERGFRTGYSDGYSSGIGDIENKAARDYQSKEEYQRADRSFNDVWGPIEDYRDGYQQGFEAGYSNGYDHKQFDSTIPTGLKRRGATGNNPQAQVQVQTNPNNSSAADNQTATVASTGSVAIPRNTILSLELMAPLSSDTSQRNDPFKARVTAPAEFADWVVEGRVTQVKRPGKVKGVAELQLSFERVTSPDNRVAGLHAELLEVVPMSSNSPTDVDAEGAVKGRDSTKDDATKVGAASGIGAIIGAIAGGGKGAAIGAIIGGGAGTAGVMTQRGHDIRLEQGQQLKIRVSADTSAQ